MALRRPAWGRQRWAATADAAGVRAGAGAGIQLEAGRSNPLLAKSAEFHWLQVASHFVGWQNYNCLFFPVLAISADKWLTCSVAFHPADCRSWLVVPRAPSCLCFSLLGEQMQGAEPGQLDPLCRSQPACGEPLRTPAWWWPILAPISNLWSWDLARGLIKALQALTSAAVLLLPAVRLLPCPPSRLAAEAQPETRDAQGCALSFFQMYLWWWHGTSLLAPRVQLPGGILVVLWLAAGVALEMLWTHRVGLSINFCIIQLLLIAVSCSPRLRSPW